MLITNINIIYDNILFAKIASKTLNQYNYILFINIIFYKAKYLINNF